MTANRKLAALKGLTEEDCLEIDRIHQEINKLLEENKGQEFNKKVFSIIESLEYVLQEIWGFEKDKSFHKYKNIYGLRSTWSGRKFRCNLTGESITVPEDIIERDIISFGKSFIDFGRFDCYSRFGGNVEEIEDE